MGKPILCLDFDGVCHSYDSGWKGAAVIPDAAVEGLFEFLEAAKEHFDVQVFSSRSHQEGGTEAMICWFMDQRRLWRKRGGKPPVDTPLEISFPTEKPAATISIDDRALTFYGSWPSMDALRAFKPWNKRNDDSYAISPVEVLEDILGHIEACKSSKREGLPRENYPVNSEWIRLHVLRGLGRKEEQGS
jgi:hypothetical protein